MNDTRILREQLSRRARGGRSAGPVRRGRGGRGPGPDEGDRDATRPSPGPSTPACRSGWTAPRPKGAAATLHRRRHADHLRPQRRHPGPSRGHHASSPMRAAAGGRSATMVDRAARGGRSRTMNLDSTRLLRLRRDDDLDLGRPCGPRAVLRPCPAGTPRFLGRVFDGGAMPDRTGRVFLVNPCEARRAGGRGRGGVIRGGRHAGDPRRGRRRDAPRGGRPARRAGGGRPMGGRGQPSSGPRLLSLPDPQAGPDALVDGRSAGGGVRRRWSTRPRASGIRHARTRCSTRSPAPAARSGSRSLTS